MPGKIGSASSIFFRKGVLLSWRGGFGQKMHKNRHPLCPTYQIRPAIWRSQPRFLQKLPQSGLTFLQKFVPWKHVSNFPKSHLAGWPLFFYESIAQRPAGKKRAGMGYPPCASILTFFFENRSKKCHFSELFCPKRGSPDGSNWAEAIVPPSQFFDFSKLQMARHLPLVRKNWRFLDFFYVNFSRPPSSAAAPPFLGHFRKFSNFRPTVCALKPKIGGIIR